MKGKISNINPKSWTNPEGVAKSFWEFTIEGQDTTYSCWQPAFSSKKVGEELDFTVSADKKGNMTRASLSSVGGGQGGRFEPKNNKSFAASYAKDMTVAFIGKDIIKTSKDADATINHYYELFLKLMEG